MTVPIARNQAVRFRGDPVVHATWMDDAEDPAGNVYVVALCGAHVDNHHTTVRKVRQDVDCMACVADPRRRWTSDDEVDDEEEEDLPDGLVLPGLR